MIEFIEDNLVFKFDETAWSHLIFYDQRDETKRPVLPELEKINKATGARSVEFLGIFQSERLVFIEVKDFRGHRIENKDRLERKDEPLEKEIAMKVKDTIAGIVGGARLSSHKRTTFKEYVRYLNNDKKIVEVVLWLEEDMPIYPPHILAKRQKTHNLNKTKQLKERLNWLTHKVLVMNKNDNDYAPFLQVDYLKNNP
jgi:hypothetical protein